MTGTRWEADYRQNVLQGQAGYRRNVRRAWRYRRNQAAADGLAAIVRRWTRDHPDPCWCLLCDGLRRFDEETQLLAGRSDRVMERWRR